MSRLLLLLMLLAAGCDCSRRWCKYLSGGWAAAVHGDSDACRACCPTAAVWRCVVSPGRHRC